ncbi:MAG: hypothetical protein KHZ80_05425 [Anaerococcus vaginalis]|uniref:LPD29 domain-containing protein n=1 Tax=Anaerococcus vaginalis TaxID=33037 RepID=UPI001D70608B|nr:LPD29 domain-containing protein [Anaerococcus vaginalis]MBS4889454.1 hypothetical protein [Anaerococcus vaginalis]
MIETTYNYNNIIGNNYNPNLTTKEIAREVKKQARKLYKGIKISVKSEYNAIFIKIKVKEYNKRNQEIKKNITDLLDSYNYDKSDVITDYFDDNFYGFVDLELI